MYRYRLLWLLPMVLSGLAPLGASYAQRPRDNTLVLELLDRIERLEEEVRYIRGEMEIQRHQIETLLQEQESSGSRSYPPGGAVASSGAASSGLERSMEGPKPPGSAQLPATPVRPPEPPPPTSSVQPPVTPAQPPVVPSPSAPVQPAPSAGAEQAAFDAALNELREGRYAEAIAGFQRFLTAYPNSKQAGEAQYWLGEAHYVSRDYSAAKEAFINLGLNYPQSERLPDALLKLGYIYGERGDNDRAREVLEKLVQVYPNTQAASLAGRRLQSLR